jgi:hypothetical protein
MFVHVCACVCVCVCGNAVPADFDYDLTTQRRVDRLARAELTHAVVEYVAPTEYMVRPPQPPVYLFVIDVSYQAVAHGRSRTRFLSPLRLTDRQPLCCPLLSLCVWVRAGVVAAVSQAILAGLDAIPNRERRTKIGLITVDSSVHFYNLSVRAPPAPRRRRAQHALTRVGGCLCVCVVCMHVCLSVGMYVCMHVCMYVHVCVCVCVSFGTVRCGCAAFAVATADDGGAGPDRHVPAAA